MRARILVATDEELAVDLAERLGLDRAADVARVVLARAEAAAVDLTVPADLDLEAAVLGACLASAACLEVAQGEGWAPEVNHHPAHRRLSAALLEHVAEAGVIDHRTSVRVADHLRARHLLAKGDVDRITDALAGSCPHPPGVAVDAARLVTLADRRRRMAEVEAELAEVMAPC